MFLFRKKPEKEAYYDITTVWEMNNPLTVFQALVTRNHGCMTRSRSKLRKQLHEYLIERGVKTYEGEKFIIYYREDDNIYSEYKEYGEKNKWKCLNKEEFFLAYAAAAHDHAVKEANNK